MTKANRTTSKQLRSTSDSNNAGLGTMRNSLVILLSILAAVIVVVFIIHLSKVASDKAKFHWAEGRLNYAKSQLSSATGLKVSSSWHNGCAATTEQLFNNAQACTTELLADYTVTSKAQAMQAQTAIDNLMLSPQVFGADFDRTATNASFNVPSHGLNCYWLNGFTPDSSRIQDGRETTITFTATCTAPSATTIYE